MRKKYNAVCFRIKKDITELDNVNIEAIYHILKRRIPIVLELEESEESAKEHVMKLLINKLKAKGLSFEYLKNISLVVNEGKEIIYSSEEKEKYFDASVQYRFPDTVGNTIKYLEMEAEEILNLGDISNTKRNIEHAQGIEINDLQPTICLKKPNEERTRSKLSITTKKLVQDAKPILTKMNGVFTRKFGVVNGMGDVFNKVGAVIFPDYEWESIDNNNPFKSIFMERDRLR